MPADFDKADALLNSARDRMALQTIRLFLATVSSGGGDLPDAERLVVSTIAIAALVFPDVDAEQRIDEMAIQAKSRLAELRLAFAEPVGRA